MEKFAVFVQPSEDPWPGSCPEAGNVSSKFPVRVGPSVSSVAPMVADAVADELFGDPGEMPAAAIPAVEFSVMVAVNELLVTDRAAVAEALAELVAKPEPCEHVLEAVTAERPYAAQVTLVLIVSAFREEPAKKTARL